MMLASWKDAGFVDMLTSPPMLRSAGLPKERPEVYSQKRAGACSTTPFHLLGQYQINLPYQEAEFIALRWMLN